MSYVPSHASSGGALAQPNALVFIPMTQSTTQTATVGTAVNLSAAVTKFGLWSVTITNNKVTLPSGYHYLIEAVIVPYYTGSATNSDYIEFQIYDETNTAYVGTKALIHRSTGEDSSLTSRDEKCRYFVDCSSTGIDISVKLTAKTAAWNRLNYITDNFTEYSGIGRIIIWRLES